MSQFQLFPPPSPEFKGPKNPFRRGAKKPAPKNGPASPIPLEEIKGSTNTESVLLQIIEDTQQFSPPPALPATSTPIERSNSPVTQSSHHSKSPQSPRNRRHQDSESSPNHRAMVSQSTSSASNTSNNSSGQNTDTTTSPHSSQSSVSPMPMRSMFPRFDPKTSLNAQNNDLQIPTATLKPKIKSNRRPNLTLTTTSDIDHVLGPKTVPASVLNFPTGALEPEEIRYSSVQELEMLWDAANGQRPQNPCGTVNLRLTRYLFFGISQ